MPTVSITSPPPFISSDEHRTLTQSTPDSFNSIPPVLRHKEDNVSVSLDPPLPGLEGDGLKGTLYITESVMAFISTSGSGFQIDYPSITLHAISRTPSGPSVYCQLDETPEGQPLPEDEESEMRELTITPEDAASLDPIFEALSVCASLHPDKASGSDDDLEDAMFADADESGGGFETFTGGDEEELSEVGRAALAHLESIIVYPPGHELHPGSATGVNGVDGATELETSEEEETSEAPGLPNGTH